LTAANCPRRDFYPPLPLLHQIKHKAFSIKHKAFSIKHKAFSIKHLAESI
jgi:hypothetical protein